jgi:excisionase family DNA binding protein
MLGVSRRIVLRWIRERRIPSEVSATGELRLRREDVMRVGVSPVENGCPEDTD